MTKNGGHKSRAESKRITRGSVGRGSAMTLATLAVVGLIAGACGGGGGSAPKSADSQTLFVKSSSLPNFSGVFLDEGLVLKFSAPIKTSTINPDSIRIRTGAQGGVSPVGTFVRGTFLVDPATGNRVVIDPDAVAESRIDRVERTGDISSLPDEVRVDLGFPQPRESAGNRQPLMDRSRRSVVTFVPEVPTRAALDDTGYIESSTYTVTIPGFPSTNTLENQAGSQLLSIDGRVFTSSFTTVPGTASDLFLGAESAGTPFLIHSTPFNGDDQVPLTDVIRLRFSQPLDPRSAADPLNYMVEIISVPAPHPVIPVSVFLAQQRLGRVEVALTPINPLPSDATIRVSISEGVEDLIGQAINPTVISFSTGVGTSPFSGDVLEEFGDNFNEDQATSTANWNGTKPYVDATPGELKAAFAPYAGDGSDGAFLASIGQTTILNTGTSTQRLYNYTTFEIPTGATVVAEGNFPLVLHCQGDVNIEGTLALNGTDGGLGLDGLNGATDPTGGVGGTAGAGGGDGGDGANATTGGGGNFDGEDGIGPGAGLGGFTGEDQGQLVRTDVDGDNQDCSSPPLSFEECRNREGGGGGGYLADGGDADNNGATGLGRNGSLFANGGDGGLQWGDDTLSFASTSVSVDVFDPNLGTTKTITLNGIPTLTALNGGSGGGGGGAEDDSDSNVEWGSADGSDDGGGGGGGGGGALQITSFGNIDVTGTVTCNGGNGGDTATDLGLTDFGQGAGGGGGSGGTIWFQCRGAATLGSLANIAVTGGSGGQGYAQSTGPTGLFSAGNGADGRIRVEDSDGIVNNAPAGAVAGVFSPALDLASEGLSTWQNTGIFTPNFQEPEIDADVFPLLTFNGTIRVYMEGAPENLIDDPGTPGIREDLIDDPDTSASTGFVLVYDSTSGGIQAGDPWDILDNNKWWRFRIDFTVDAFHLFTDPMPTVRSARFNITETQ